MELSINASPGNHLRAHTTNLEDRSRRRRRKYATRGCAGDANLIACFLFHKETK